MEWQNDWWSNDEKIDDGVVKMIDSVEWWWKIDGVWRNDSNDWWCDIEKLMMAKWLMVWWWNYWCWSMISKMERQNKMLVKTN